MGQDRSRRIESIQLVKTEIYYGLASLPFGIVTVSVTLVLSQQDRYHRDFGNCRKNVALVIRLI